MRTSDPWMVVYLSWPCRVQKDIRSASALMQAVSCIRRSRGGPAVWSAKAATRDPRVRSEVMTSPARPRFTGAWHPTAPTGTKHVFCSGIPVLDFCLGQQRERRCVCSAAGTLWHRHVSKWA